MVEHNYTAHPGVPIRYDPVLEDPRRYETKPRREGRGKPITMSKASFIKEHKKLIPILESGTAAQRRKEAQEQRAELKARGGGAPWRYAHKSPAFFDYM
jgi:hypothetical protein